jgi:RyR domain
MYFTDGQIAEAIHLMNGWLQEQFGDPYRQPPWPDAPQPMKDMVLALVRGYRAGISPQAAHERWVEAMEARGWRYGLRRSERDRTHPNMLPWGLLPQEQRLKDVMSQQITWVLVAAGER